MGVLSLIAENHKEWVEICRVFGVKDYPEDIVQDMYMKIESSNIDINKSNYKGYVYIALRNLCYDRHKSKLHYLEVDDNLTPDNQLADDYLKCLNVQQILHELPYFERKVIDLHRIQGISLSEIERVTGICRVKMTKARDRGVKKLKKHLID